MTSQQPLFARQPIYDVNLNVKGYELLFRPGDHEQEFDDDIATSSVVLNAFSEVGLDKATEYSNAFINMPKSWLISPPPFKPKSIVIEILETVDADSDVISAVKRLKQQGYTIALDDFEYDESKRELIELADIIKVDVLAVQGEHLEQLVAILKPYNKVLLAEKVEDYQVYEQCQSLGFTLFQGYFLCRPQVFEGTVLPANKLVLMRLLADLQKPDVSIKDLKKSIVNDPTLSVKLLKIINSAQYALHSKVDSVQQAITLLGLEKLKCWASVIALSKLAEKPSELLSLTLTRAKMLEHLANDTNARNPDMYFTIGLFSSVDAFFDQEKQSILDTLPLEQEVCDALLSYSGPAGKLLQAAINHEQGYWDKVDWPSLSHLNVNEEMLENAYTEGLRWAIGIMSSLLT
ncbi:MAG: EAL domain-containing protein [Gammaproteobacteria bacterium]|nr:MAG: EAL domain-containing protein [Gammaproteobacteria bacterium]